MKRNIFTLLILFSISVMGFGQSQRLVLLEHFTQASCGPCAGVNPQLKALLNANPDKLTAIMVHTSWPGYDPMYNHNVSDNGNRTSYYSVNSVPNSVLDGNFFNGHPNNWNISTVDARLEVPSPFELQIQMDLSPDEEVVYATMLIHATQDVEDGLRAYMTVIEKLIQFSSAPGSNGETQFNNVMKKILPKQSGYSMPAMSAGEYIIIESSWVHQNVYTISELALVGFIQDGTSKEVHQAAPSSTIVPLYNLDVDLKDVSNYSNYSCNGIIQPLIEIRNNGSTEITSLEISYTINGGDPILKQWTGNLGLLEKETVSLDESTFTVEDMNNLEISLNNPNGSTDDYLANNSRIIEIERAIHATAPMTLLLKTDANPQETTWEVVSSSGEVIQEGGPYTNANQVHFESIEISSSDCYTFYIYDAGGDGLIGGQVILADADNNSILQESSFGPLAQTQFSVLFEGLEELSSVENFDVYPNPVTDNANLNINLLSQSNVSYFVSDLLGQKIISVDLGSVSSGNRNYMIDFEGQKPGVYFISIEVNGVSTSKKILLSN